MLLFPKTNDVEKFYIMDIEKNTLIMQVFTRNFGLVNNLKINFMCFLILNFTDELQINWAWPYKK